MASRNCALSDREPGCLGDGVGLGWFLAGFVLGALLIEGRLIRKQQRMILQELKRMATNDGQLVQADQDLTAAFSDFLSNNNTLITTLENKLATIQQSQTAQADPEISTAAADIETIVAQLRANSQAAQQATAALNNPNPPSADAVSTSVAPSSAAASSTTS